MFWLRKSPNKQPDVAGAVLLSPEEWECQEFEGVVCGMSSWTSSSEDGQFWMLHLDDEEADPIWFFAGFSAALVFTYRTHRVKFVLRRRVSGPGWFEDDCNACLVSFTNFEQEMVDDNVPDPFAPVSPRKGRFQALIGRR